MSTVRNLLPQKLRLMKRRKMYEYGQLEEEIVDNVTDDKNNTMIREECRDEAVQPLLAKTEVTSKSEKGPNLFEKRRASSPRDVTEFDAFTGLSNCNGERAFQAVKVIKADAVQTGVSNYKGESAFQSKKVAKVDAVPTGVSNYSGEGAFQALKVNKADAVPRGVSNYSGDGAFQARKVVKADAVPRGASNYCGDGAFQAKKVFKADAVPTGISKYSGESTFQSKRVVKADSIQTGMSKYCGESAFATKKVAKADSIQTGTSKYCGESVFTTIKVAKSDSIKTGASSYTGATLFQTRKIGKTIPWRHPKRASKSYLRDSTSTAQKIPDPTVKIPEARGQSSLPSCDNLSPARPTVTYSSRHRAIAIVLLCAGPILRLLLLTFSSSSLMNINALAGAVIIKDISSTLEAAAILELELEEAISQSSPNLIAVQENQAIPAPATGQHAPEYQSLQQLQEQPLRRKLRSSGSGTVQRDPTLLDRPSPSLRSMISQN